MLNRELEPEVMDDADEVAAYDAMPHDAVNRQFVLDFLQAWSTSDRGSTNGPIRALDLGTGTALIPIELANQAAQFQITAVDSSTNMLKAATSNLSRSEFMSRIELVHADAHELPFADHTFDAVISNTLIHHLPDPQPCLNESVRVLKPGGLLLIRDLFRPESAAEIERLVALHAADATAQQQQLLRQSLQASLTVAEIEQRLGRIADLSATVHTTSDRHWTLTGHKRDQTPRI